MQARLTAFLLWAAVAATIVYWGLRLGARAPSVPRQAVPVSTAAGARGALDRLLGQNAPAAEEAPVSADNGRFQLVGVVAPRGDAGDTEGLAVIVVDGKPARTYRVGAAIDDRFVLQSVRTRGATLGPRGGSAQVQLELPPPPVASTGTLPAAGSDEAAAGLPAGRQPPGGAAPRNLPPGQMQGQFPGQMPGQMPQGMRQQIPPQPPMPQEMPVQEAPVQQDVEPAEPPQGQGG